MRAESSILAFRDVRLWPFASQLLTYKRVMPHSEYPSGSACLCEAIQEFTDAYFVRTGGQSIGLAATVAAGSSNVEP